MKKYFLLGLSAVCLLACQPKATTTQTTSTQPIYDQIDKTQTMRCGYIVWPPAFSIEPNTKQKGGVFYDVTQEIGKRLNLKIEWTEELGWATAVEAVKTHRVDAICSGLFVNANRARQADFSTPVSYSLLYAWKSVNSDKNYPDISDLNKPDVRFGYVDGTTPDKIIHQQFSQSNMISNPELTPISDLLVGLTSKKYDVMMVDVATVNDFLKKNPGSIVSAVNKPVAIMPNVMMLPAGETKLKAMLDNTIRELIYDGTVKKILAKNGVLNDYQLPAKPYQE